MEYHILESVHQDVLFLQDLSGEVWPMMYVTGVNPAFLVSEERFSAMFKFAQRRFLFPSEDSHMYMLTLWDPYLLHMGSHISSHASTGQQDGRKLYLWLEFLHQSVPPPCFMDGYRGLAFLQLLQVTEELSSPHPYGLPSAPC